MSLWPSFLAHPVQCIVMSASVCLSVCLSMDLSQDSQVKTSPYLLCVLRALWASLDPPLNCCKTLCISAFVSWIASLMFAHNRPSKGVYSKWLTWGKHRTGGGALLDGAKRAGRAIWTPPVLSLLYHSNRPSWSAILAMTRSRVQDSLWLHNNTGQAVHVSWHFPGTKHYRLSASNDTVQLGR